MSERVDFSLADDGVARVRLVWAERRNAIDPAMVDQLADAVARCGNPTVRAVLISADGPAFTVGGDMSHFATRTGDLGAALAAMVPAYHDVLGALAELDAPIVTAAHGAVAGGGLGLAWSADVLLAAEGTLFATGFSKLGLSGDGGSSWWLPRLAGLGRARQLLVAGRVIDAREAHDWGLVSEVLAPEALQERAELLAAELAAGPTFALAQMRRLLLASAAPTLAEHLQRETEAMLACGERPEASEGVSAFIERRRANFNDRIGAKDG